MCSEDVCALQLLLSLRFWSWLPPRGQGFIYFVLFCFSVLGPAAVTLLRGREGRMYCTSLAGKLKLKWQWIQPLV